MKPFFLKKLFVIVLVGVPFLYGNAIEVSNKVFYVELESFRFSTFRSPEIDRVDKSLVAKHYLGDDVAVLYYIFRNTYVQKQTDSYSGNLTGTVIQKPAIYDSIIKINKQLKKAVKKGSYTKDEAIEIMKDCLEKSYAVFFVETTDLEMHMSKLSDLEQYIKLYENISFE